MVTNFNLQRERQYITRAGNSCDTTIHLEVKSMEAQVFSRKGNVLFFDAFVKFRKII